MAVMDKKMYEKMKNWCDRSEGCRPRNQAIMYVNSHDRELTNATIRKMMFDMTEEDFHGELFISFYSARNFYHNMRDYYSYISKLYGHTSKDDETVMDIIEDYPPTCGWIILIVEDIENLSDDDEKMQEMMRAILEFACNRASIILIGNGEYKDVFSGCEYALREMEDGIAAKEDDDIVMIGCYEQEKAPEREDVIYENQEKHCDELVFYWDVLYKQLKKRYFDYGDFKALYKESLEYIIPRVSSEQVYRKDLMLIENIGALRRENHDDVEGCKLWEFDAAQKLSKGLHRAIINKYNYNDDFSDGKIEIDVEIEDAKEDFGAIHISGYTSTTVELEVETVYQEIDSLSRTICECTYKGDSMQAWRYLGKKYAKNDNTEGLENKFEEAGINLNCLMEDIKDIADRTINEHSGKKVRRYKGGQDDVLS